MVWQRKCTFHTKHKHRALYSIIVCHSAIVIVQIFSKMLNWRAYTDILLYGCVKLIEKYTAKTCPINKIVVSFMFWLFVYALCALYAIAWHTYAIEVGSYTENTINWIVFGTYKQRQLFALTNTRKDAFRTEHFKQIKQRNFLFRRQKCRRMWILLKNIIISRQKFYLTEHGNSFMWKTTKHDRYLIE